MNPSPSSPAHEIHNATVGDIVRGIVNPVNAAGGDGVDIMVMLESVVCGVVLVLSNGTPAADAALIASLADGAKIRMQEIRSKVRGRQN